MTENIDAYAKGMVNTTEEQFDITPELDAFQYEMIKPHLGKTILEIGAGAGRISSLLLADRSVSFDRFVISEPSDYFFNHLRKRLKTDQHIRLTQGITGELVQEFGPEFNTIFSVHVLEHIQDDRKFVIECLEMLRDDGKLVILVPALQFLYSNLDRNIGHYRRYDKRMIRKLLEPLDVSIVEMYYTNFISVFASLIFFKILKVDYQKSATSKSRFIVLQKIYSKLLPVMNWLERMLPLPFGLNLTVVIEKKSPNDAQKMR